MANWEALRIIMPVERWIVAARRARVLINSGALLVSAAASFIILHTSPRANEEASAATATTTAAVPEYALVVAFIVFLPGVSLVTLALVAEQFPGAARVGAAIARALNRYLFGGR